MNVPERVVLIMIFILLGACNRRGPIESFKTASGIVDNPVFRNEEVTFQLPGIFEFDSVNLASLKERSKTIVAFYRCNANDNEVYDVTLNRFVLDKVTPMEITFAINALKPKLTKIEGVSTEVTDFDIYDFAGKRYRKISMDWDPGKMVSYYFMANDNDSVVHELSIDSYNNSAVLADSLITEIAHSFKFVDQ